MKEGLDKFRKLLLTDEEFQMKLKAAAEAYTGEQTEEAVFNNVIVPVANEYGISATFEEYKAYIENLSDQEMDDEEIVQVAAGGKNMKGFGAAACIGCGLGFGGGLGDDRAFACLAIGGGGNASGCAWEGSSVTITEPQR